MPHTLVTGANSFVAAHVIKTLVDAGHTVTGSVRRASAGEAVLEEHPEWAGKLDFVEIQDYAETGIWDAVFQSKDFDYIVHVAAPLLDNPANTDYDRDYLRPSVEGNLSLLRSAKTYAKNLKAIAITGSINAITTGDDLATRTLTNESYNAITPDMAREMNNPYISYCSSKKEAELAVWKFVETEHPSFSVTILLPALIFGPPIQPVKSVKNLNFSIATLYSLFNGSNTEIPGTMFPSYIDVRDLAEAHVKALTTPEAKNHRYLIGGMDYSNTLAVRTLKDAVPELEGRLPKESGEDQKIVFGKTEAAIGNGVLGMKFRTPAETFGDAARKILEIEKRG